MLQAAPSLLLCVALAAAAASFSCSVLVAAVPVVLVSEALPPGSGVRGNEKVADSGQRDTRTNTTTLVSVAANASAALDAASALGDMTPDGRFVAFWSVASNVVAYPSDVSTNSDVFVRDMLLGATVAVSVIPSGAAFGNLHSGDNFCVAISATGRYVAFVSVATDLVAVDNNSQGHSSFLRDLWTNVTTLVSVDSLGIQPAVGSSFYLDLSDDGLFLVIGSSAPLDPSDTNDMFDLYLRDLTRSSTTLISVSSAGTGPANNNSYAPRFSADGTAVVYVSQATDLVAGLLDNNAASDVFVWQQRTNTTVCASVALSGGPTTGRFLSDGPSSSANGDAVVYYSYADDLVADDMNSRSDVFLRNISAATTTRVSVRDDGSEASGGSFWADIAADVYAVAFESNTDNGVFGSSSGGADTLQMFLRNSGLVFGGTPTPSPTASLSLGASASITPTPSLSVGSSASITPTPSLSAGASTTLSASPQPTLCTTAANGVCVVTTPVVISTSVVVVGVDLVLNSSSVTFQNGSGLLTVVNGSVTIVPRTVLVVRVSSIPSTSGDEILLITADGGVFVGENVSIVVDSSGVDTSSLDECERIVARPVQRGSTTSFAVLLSVERDDSVCGGGSGDKTNRIIYIVVPISAVLLCLCFFIVLFALLYWLFRTGRCYRLFRFEDPEDRKLRKQSKSKRRNLSLRSSTAAPADAPF